MSRLSVLMSSTALSLGLASSALANGPTRLGVDLSFGISGNQTIKTAMVTSSKLELAAPLTDESALIAQWGVILATADTSVSGLETDYAAVANPLLGWAIRFGEGFALTPSVTLPVAKMPQRPAVSDIAEFTHESAIGQRRGLDRWLWRPDRFAVVIPASLVLWFEPLLIETHAKVAFLFNTHKAHQDDDSDTSAADEGEVKVDDTLVLQAQMRVAARLAPRFWLGAEFSAVYVPTSGGNNAELALKPELRYVTGDYSHVDLSFTLNLDQPLGPSWEPGRFWAVMIGTSFAL